MKKIVFILIVIIYSSCVGKYQKKTDNKDSIVSVYGYKDFSIDSEMQIPYDTFVQYKDSFISVYDTTIHRIVYMRSVCKYKYGDYVLNAKGDTLFCVEDDYAKFVDAREWHEYYEKYK